MTDRSFAACWAYCKSLFESSLAEPRGAVAGVWPRQRATVLPSSWSCEFDCGHPRHIIAPSQASLNMAMLFEQAADKNGEAGHAYFMILSVRSTELPCQGYFLGRPGLCCS